MGASGGTKSSPIETPHGCACALSSAVRGDTRQMSTSTTFRVSGQASKHGIGIARSKRGIARKPRDAQKLLAEAKTWLDAEYADAVRSSEVSQHPSGEARLDARLHPAATPLVTIADDDGQVT